ncbi:MAG: hypothetical protein HY329_03725 [Chloroflexi bacterium]|nr:hypothetical protein [Chloroflexota bacterium]
MLATYEQAAQLYEGSVQVEDELAHVTLRGDKVALRAHLEALVARETGCCSFLSFTVAELAVGYQVQVAAAGLEAADLRGTSQALFPNVSESQPTEAAV